MKVISVGEMAELARGRDEENVRRQHFCRLMQTNSM